MLASAPGGDEQDFAPANRRRHRHRRTGDCPWRDCTAFSKRLVLLREAPPSATTALSRV
jgi:hypothetical protein